MPRIISFLVFCTFHYFCIGTWCDFDKIEEPYGTFPCGAWSRPKASDGKKGFRVLNNHTIKQENRPQIKDSFGRNTGKFFSTFFPRVG